ncbi:hypothetical protein [Salinactinospora qingdaonensis]|uniref:Peptidase inhibitor family I36 n=1 Tax=Salinactinospora qingdaonensis TaxID=702744 RepID=A0ABP7EXG1_9ACTN
MTTRNRTGTRGSASAGAVAATALLAAILPAAPAAAAEPTNRQLLEQCGNGTDTCVFHPDGPPQYYQNTSEVVGSPAYNCTDRSQLMSVTWSDTVSESNSVGISMSATFGTVFKTTFEASYGYEWSESHTESQTTYVDVPVGHVGRVYYGAMMQRVSGTYEMHFGDPYYGHYIWYVPFEATGPAEDQGGAWTQSTSVMTAQERATYCD